MTGYEPRGHYGQQEQHGQEQHGPDEQVSGEEWSGEHGSGEQEPGQRRRQYNDEVYPQPGEYPRTDQFRPQAAGSGYRPPDHVPTQWVARPEQFSPYTNPVMSPRPDLFRPEAPDPQAPDPLAPEWWDRQPWDLVTREPEQQQPRDSGPRLVVPTTARNFGLRGAEPFWYALGRVAAGAAYLLKLPAKKAAAEILTELHRAGGGPDGGYSLGGAETFWYVLLCFPFGGAYFAKVSAKKALWEMVTLVRDAPGTHRDALVRVLSGDQKP